MSEVFSPQSSLFNAPPPDNDAQRVTLARELRVAKGFTLIFALCNSAAERARQMNALRADIPELRIQDVPIRKQIPHLLDVLRATLDDPAPDAVFVHGLENWIPSDANPHAVPFLLNLNAARNHFLADCPCPLVLWMPDYLLRLIIGGAPDFASVRSGLYVFTTSPAEAQSAMQTLRSLGYTATYGLPLDEKRERLEELSRLLTQLRNLPEDRRNPQDEIYLISQLGQMHFIMGHYDEAISILQEELAFGIKRLGRKHPDTANTLSNLARIYYEQHQYEQAETLYQEALAIKENTLGREHLNTVGTLANLAQLYLEQGQYDRAEPLLQEALAIYEKVQGREHPSTATALNDLAGLYVERGQYDRAEPLYEESLATSSKTLGREHPDTARTLYNLAWLYSKQGQYDRAELFYQEALAINAKTLGLDHPDTQMILKNINYLQSILHP